MLDLDIKSFFDDIDRELLMRAVRSIRTARGCCFTLKDG
jgi:hypothetical protein